MYSILSYYFAPVHCKSNFFFRLNSLLTQTYSSCLILVTSSVESGEPCSLGWQEYILERPFHGTRMLLRAYKTLVPPCVCLLHPHRAPWTATLQGRSGLLICRIPSRWLAKSKVLKIISNRGQVSAGGKSGSQGLHPGTYNLKPEFFPVSSLENLISLEVEPLSTSHCLICLVKYWATQEAVCNS